MLKDKGPERPDSWQPNWRVIGSTTVALLIAIIIIIIGITVFDIAVLNRGLGILGAGFHEMIGQTPRLLSSSSGTARSLVESLTASGPPSTHWSRTSLL